jgi:hypothetical protein
MADFQITFAGYSCLDVEAVFHEGCFPVFNHTIPIIRF